MTAKNHQDLLHDSLYSVFRDDEHEFRVLPAEEGATACKVLYFIRSTAIMARLDEAFGPFGWRTTVHDVEGPAGKRGLAVSLTVNIDGREVTRTGVGTQHASAFEGIVGAYDGAFARAAAQLGVGRYLWEIPEIFVELNEDGDLTKHPLDLLMAALNG